MTTTTPWHRLSFSIFSFQGNTGKVKTQLVIFTFIHANDNKNEKDIYDDNESHFNNVGKNNKT